MILMLTSLALAADQGAPTPSGGNLTLSITLNMGSPTTQCRVVGGGATAEAFTGISPSVDPNDEVFDFDGFQGTLNSLLTPVDERPTTDDWFVGAHVDIQCQGTGHGSAVDVNVATLNPTGGATPVIGTGHGPLQGADGVANVNVPIGPPTPYRIGLDLDRATASSPASADFEFTFTALP